MHIPSKIINLKDTQFPQIRLGLLGEPATGKTWSSLTFPNPIVLDFDGGMTAFSGKDILVIPFHEAKFTEDYFQKPKAHITAQPNRRDALLKWLREESTKMEQGQTLILDSWTSIINAFWAQQKWEPRYTKQGQIDEYAPWESLIEYCVEVHTLLKSIKCHVVVNFHELKVRDEKTGFLLEKISPLQQGKFLAQLKSHYTDFFRCLSTEKKQKDPKTEKEYKTGTEYWWQVRSDNMFEVKTRLKIPESTFLVEPHFKIFEQYKA